MTRMQENPERSRVDLFRLLPPTALWALALVVVALVAGAAWWSGRNDAVPAWITRYLVPALGWIWIVLALVALVTWWRGRRQAGAGKQGRSNR